MNDIDSYAAHLLTLQNKREEIGQQIEAIKTMLAEECGEGTTLLPSGIKIVVRQPNRRFDLPAALQALTPEQQKLVLTPDATRVKQQLPPAVAESFYHPGTGRMVVSVS